MARIYSKEGAGVRFQSMQLIIISIINFDPQVFCCTPVTLCSNNMNTNCADCTKPSQDEIDAIIDICVTNRPSTWATITSNWTNCNGSFKPWPSSPVDGISQRIPFGEITSLYAWLS
jgi:hypothetical protein